MNMVVAPKLTVTVVPLKRYIISLNFENEYPPPSLPIDLPWPWISQVKS